MRVTGEGIKETIISGLSLICRTRAYDQAMRFRGNVRLTVDLDESRERRRR